MDREIGAAVIGLGVGRVHLGSYQTLEGARVVAIADVSAEALEKAKTEHGIPFASTDYREAIDRPEVEVVSVCTPDRHHAEQVVYALQRGKSVLCEKPIATDMADLRRIVAAVRASDLTFAAGHNYRFIPQFASLQQAVARGDIGRPFLVDTCYIQDLWGMKSLGADYWRFKDPQDLFVGGAVHNVDLLQWLAGEVEEVHSYANNVLDFWPVENNYTTNLRFRNGCIGHILLELGAKRKRKFDVRLRAFGLEGSLEADNATPEVIRDLGDAPGEEPEVVRVEAANSHQLEIEHFLNCVRTGKRPLVDIEQAAKVMAVCYAAVRSAREGGSVKVGYEF